MKGEERHGVKVFYTGRARGDTSIDPGGEVSIDNPQRGYLTSHPRLLGPWECELALATRPAQLSSIGTRGPPPHQLATIRSAVQHFQLRLRNPVVGHQFA